MAKASDVVATTRRVLQDYDADRHTDADILLRVNGARRALAIAKPDVYSTVSIYTMVAGCRQPVPADCNVFYELQGNRNSSDVLISPMPTVTQREHLDRYQIGWQTAAAGPTEHFMFDERLPGYFFVSPPAVAGAKVDVAYARIPANIALNDDLNAQESLLQDALADYAISRCLLEDGESPANAQRGVMHMSLFATATGSNLKALLRSSPNVANEGGNLNKG